MTAEEIPDVRVDSELLVKAIPNVPTVDPGQDLFELMSDCLRSAGMGALDHDVLVVASKIISRAQDCFVDLSTVEPSRKARELALQVDKDPRLVELILRESHEISRKREGVLITRHRLGFISANSGIDSSNASPPADRKGDGPWVLTLPRDPDGTAASLKACFRDRLGVDVGIVITDSWGRPFRRGTMGFALGFAGVPALWDRRGAIDRDGRTMEFTEFALADAIAAAADLVAGQANEGRPITLVRGIRCGATPDTSKAILRESEDDLYA